MLKQLYLISSAENPLFKKIHTIYLAFLLLIMINYVIYLPFN